MKNTYRFTGIILGISIIIIGLVMVSNFNRFGGTTTFGYTFGADFYTEQYKATQNAANNIEALGDMICNLISMLGYLTACLGGCVVCFFAGQPVFKESPQTSVGDRKQSHKLSDVQTSNTQEEVSEELPDL